MVQNRLWIILGATVLLLFLVSILFLDSDESSSKEVPKESVEIQTETLETKTAMEENTIHLDEKGKSVSAATGDTSDKNKTETLATETDESDPDTSTQTDTNEKSSMEEQTVSKEEFMDVLENQKEAFARELGEDALERYNEKREAQIEAKEERILRKEMEKIHEEAMDEWRQEMSQAEKEAYRTDDFSIVEELKIQKPKLEY